MNKNFLFELHTVINIIKRLGLLKFVHRIIDNHIYQKKIDNLPSHVTPISSISSDNLTYTPMISIVVPTYNTPLTFFCEMVDSIMSQTYSNWELCIADGSLNNSELRNKIKEYSTRDCRIKYTFLSNNLGISGNTNAALNLCTGEYIALMDHDDILANCCLSEVVSVLNQHKSDIIYTDEDKFTIKNAKFFQPHFKPGYSPDLLLSTNYISHFFVFNSHLLSKTDSFLSNFDGSQDYDFILRLTAKAKTIVHIPKVLYHWRVHNGSTAGNAQSKSYTFSSGENALYEFINKYDNGGVVHLTHNPGYYNVQFTCTISPLVTIFLFTETCNHNIFEFIQNNTSYSNYTIVTVSSLEEINIYINTSTTNGFYCILSNIKSIGNPHWLTLLVSNELRKNAGVVSAKTYYKNKIDQSGLSYDKKGTLFPIYNNFSKYSSGYFMTADIRKNSALCSCSCVLFDLSKLNYSYRFPLWGNIQYAINDLCFTFGEENYFNIIEPDLDIHILNKTNYSSILIPHEFQVKWKYYLEKGDIFLPPALRFLSDI